MHLVLDTAQLGRDNGTGLRRKNSINANHAIIVGEHRGPATFMLTAGTLGAIKVTGLGSNEVVDGTAETVDTLATGSLDQARLNCCRPAVLYGETACQYVYVAGGDLSGGEGVLGGGHRLESLSHLHGCTGLTGRHTQRGREVGRRGRPHAHVFDECLSVPDEAGLVGRDGRLEVLAPDQTGVDTVCREVTELLVGHLSNQLLDLAIKSEHGSTVEKGCDSG